MSEIIKIIAKIVKIVSLSFLNPILNGNQINKTSISKINIKSHIRKYIGFIIFKWFSYYIDCSEENYK